MSSTGKLARVADLTLSQRDEMFALMESYYEGVDRATFDTDLDEKEWVIEIRDEEANRLRGFSTQMLLEAEAGARRVRALFSGDTIVAEDARGERSLFQVSGWLVRDLLSASPDGELYWFLISKGYKTYRFLPLFYHEFYPRHDVPTPPRFAAVLDALAGSKFPASYDRARGIVKAGPSSYRLRAGVADLTADRLRDPHIRFFAERNPGHALGDELCCLAPLTLANFTSTAYRAMGARPREGCPSHEPGYSWSDQHVTFVPTRRAARARRGAGQAAANSVSAGDDEVLRRLRPERPGCAARHQPSASTGSHDRDAWSLVRCLARRRHPPAGMALLGL